MEETKAETKAGWAMPPHANKYHYFEGGRSLCCKWGYWGPVEPDSDYWGDTDEDCVTCCKKLAARKAKKGGD